jgi:hypothetical protein
MPSSPRPLLNALALLVAADLCGLVVGVTDDFASLGAAVVNGTYTNAPLPIYGLQITGVALLLAGRGRLAATGGCLALLTCTASLGAVLFDGDFAHAGLGAGHVAIQATIAALTAIVWGLTAARLAQRRRAVPLLRTTDDPGCYRLGTRLRG